MKLQAENAELLRNVLVADQGEEVSTESGVKIVKQTLTKKTIMDRKVSRTCLVLAKQEGDALYEKYQKHFTNLRMVRDAIRKKYMAKARAVVKKSMV